jgi:hypothetical protein
VSTGVGAGKNLRVLPPDAADKMLSVLARGGWHGWEEIADECGIEGGETMVLATYHQLRARGYALGVIEQEHGRYRWTPA